MIYCTLPVYQMFHQDFYITQVYMTFFSVHYFVVHHNFLHLFWMFQYLINLDLVIHHNLLYFYWTYCCVMHLDFYVTQVYMTFFKFHYFVAHHDFLQFFLDGQSLIQFGLTSWFDVLLLDCIQHTPSGLLCHLGVHLWSSLYCALWLFALSLDCPSLNQFGLNHILLYFYWTVYHMSHLDFYVI